MKTFEEFVRTIIPNILTKYEFYKLCQMDEGKGLIGIKVVAIRAGFSCNTEGGTKMTIESITDVNGDKPRYVHLAKNEDTWQQCENGWGCTLDELPYSVIPYN